MSGTPLRICGTVSLAVSRAFGDACFKDPALPHNEQAVCVVPDITTHTFEENSGYIVIGSDGIFEQDPKVEGGNRCDDIIQSLEQSFSNNMEIHDALNTLLDESLCPVESMEDTSLGKDNMTVMYIPL